MFIEDYVGQSLIFGTRDNIQDTFMSDGLVLPGRYLLDGAVFVVDSIFYVRGGNYTT